MSAHSSKRDRVVGESQIVYQAPGAQYPADRFGVGRGSEFLALLAEMARYLRGFATSQKEYDVCTDVMKGKRLSIAGLERLVDIAARAERPFVLEDTLHRAVLDRMTAPRTCPFEASQYEQQSNGPADEAQLLFAREKTPVRAIQTAEVLQTQAYATKQAIDALWRYAREGGAA